ncbi:SDR family oxidoreductase [Micrococcus luteus]|nr:SDR family oxidoreductase [Micrococcus luteus]MCV7573690.1 SDR family oxidoreductase [Micrococcus luteus]
MTETTANQTLRAAVVTGATTGIGRAAALELARRGWRVYAVGRRAERLDALAAQAREETVPGEILPVAADVTDEAAVAELTARVEADGGIDTLVNIAGGARGTEAVGAGRREDWEWMYRANVLGTLTMCRAFLPMLRAHGEGTVLNLTSTAALTAYEGGAGYNAAKMGQHGLTAALRLEEAEHNVRVIEVLPGMVHTEEFALRRMGGDAEAAGKVYAGVAKPLTAEDVAEVCVHALELPHHVNLDQIVLRPVAQAAQHKLIRRPVES